MSRKNSYSTLVSFHPRENTLIVDKFDGEATVIQGYPLSKGTLDLFNVLTNELTSTMSNNTRYFSTACIGYSLSTLFKPAVETYSNRDIVANTLLEMLSKALSKENVETKQYDKLAYRELKELTPIEKNQLKEILANSDIKTWKLVVKKQNIPITLNNNAAQRKNGMRV